MIHEIAPYRFNNQFLAIEEIGEEDYVFHFKGNSLLMKKSEEGFEIPRRKDIPGISSIVEKRFLFTLDEVPCFLIFEGSETENGWLVYHEVNINFFRTHKSKEIAWVSMVAFQLMNWYAQNKFCGKCGSATHQKSDERAIVCPTCNAMIFPKISPAVIVAILCGDKIALASNSAFRAGWFSLIAGYSDVGESLEETVVREVKEEIGLDVKNIRYYKSQPWPFSGSLMIGFFAEAECSQEIRIDNKEITEAAWFTRGNLPNHPANISIAGEMIEKFENGEI